MSLQQALRAKKDSLKPTTTTITHLDGRKFQNSTEIPRAQYGFVVDTKPDNIPAKITENVFLGSQDCCDSQILKNYGIGRVLSVGVASTKCDNVEYKFVPCLDLPETNLREVVEECVGFIERDRHRSILVHCNAGVSRSASVVIGYLILVHHFSFHDAYSLVKKARVCVRPNDGFLAQLKEF